MPSRVAGLGGVVCRGPRIPLRFILGYFDAAPGRGWSGGESRGHRISATSNRPYGAGPWWPDFATRISVSRFGFVFLDFRFRFGAGGTRFGVVPEDPGEADSTRSAPESRVKRDGIAVAQDAAKRSPGYTASPGRSPACGTASRESVVRVMTTRTVRRRRQIDIRIDSGDPRCHRAMPSRVAGLGRVVCRGPRIPLRFILGYFNAAPGRGWSWWSPDFAARISVSCFWAPMAPLAGAGPVVWPGGHRIPGLPPYRRCLGLVLVVAGFCNTYFGFVFLGSNGAPGRGWSWWCGPGDTAFPATSEPSLFGTGVP